MAVPAGLVLVAGVAVVALLGNFALHKVEEGKYGRAAVRLLYVIFTDCLCSSACSGHVAVYYRVRWLIM